MNAEIVVGVRDIYPVIAVSFRIHPQLSGSKN